MTKGILRRLHKDSKGFTLIELMIVVAIIGILAAIAIPNFLRFQLKSKTAEAKTNIGAIKTTEIAYSAEYDEFITCVATPALAPLTTKTPWVIATANQGFGVIGYQPAGDVYYSYGVLGAAVPGALGAAAKGADVAAGAGVAVTAAVDIIINAVSDLDGDGTAGGFWMTDNLTDLNDWNPGQF